MKLELGAGNRPTPGYCHNDLHDFPGVDLVGEPRSLDLPTNSVQEVLALAFMEHLTYNEFYDTLRNVRRMLEPGAQFLFDVPDYPIWARYYLDLLAGKPAPLPMDHVLRTLFGWQRWPGDEHKSGWDKATLEVALIDAGFTKIQWGVKHFTDREIYRKRFSDVADAHLYVMATK